MPASCSDFQTLWEAAATEFRTQIKIKPPDNKVVYATVYCLYFPFRGGKNTLPNLTEGVSREKGAPNGSTRDAHQRGGSSHGGRGGRGGKSSSSKNEVAGLGRGGAIADHLVHVFWMGRYLPRGLGGRDEQLKWMKPRKEQSTNIPDRVWRRVRSFIFLPPEFEADRTKQALVPGASYTRTLMSQADRRAQDRYCSWVAEANKTFDEEIWFDKPIEAGQIGGSAASSILSQQALSQSTNHDAADSNRGFIDYEAVFLGGNRFALGDKIEYSPLNGMHASRAAKAVIASASASVSASSSSSSSTSAPVSEKVSAVSGSRSSKKFGVLKHIYQITDSYSREKIGMIGVVSQSALLNAESELTAPTKSNFDGLEQTGTDHETEHTRTMRLISDIPEESFLASSLVRKVDDSEWGKKIKQHINNKPAKIEWKECRLSKHNGGGEKLQKGATPPLAPVRSRLSSFQITNFAHSNHMTKKIELRFCTGDSWFPNNALPYCHCYLEWR